MIQYEFKKVVYSNTDELNELGKKGWNVCHVNYSEILLSRQIPIIQQSKNDTVSLTDDEHHNILLNEIETLKQQNKELKINNSVLQGSLLSRKNEIRKFKIKRENEVENLTAQISKWKTKYQNTNRIHDSVMNDIFVTLRDKPDDISEFNFLSWNKLINENQYLKSEIELLTKNSDVYFKNRIEYLENRVLVLKEIITKANAALALKK